MRHRALLERIWDGSVTVLPDPEASRTGRFIQQIMPIRLVYLIASRPDDKPQLLPESVELMPGVSLGDVLAEELGIEVPYGALVLIETARSLNDDLGDGHHIECRDGQEILDIVNAFGAKATASDPIRSRVPSSDRLGVGFRDRGLNDRFFRTASAQPGARAAG